MRRQILCSAAGILAISACSTKGPTQPDSTDPSPTSDGDVRAGLEALLTREAGPFDRHPVQPLPGLIAGTVEAASTPLPECGETDGHRHCLLVIDTGPTDTGQASNILCMTTTDLLGVGPFLRYHLEDGSLQETPVVTSREIGDGVAVWFVADFTDPSAEYVGTLKVATHYAHGYTTNCVDRMGGGRQTFDRITSSYFESLKFEPNPVNEALLAVGYRTYFGTQTTGLRYTMIAPDAKQGFVERGVSFKLETDGTYWHVHDGLDRAVISNTGSLSEYESAWSTDGELRLSLSAERLESGRVKVRAATGSRSASAELTPQAPLSTELWSGPSLQRLARGSRRPHRYAIPSIGEDGPTVRYVELRALERGAVAERTVDEGNDDDPEPDDRLFVDETGVVTKEVARTHVAELIHRRGTLPRPTPSGRRARRARR